MTLGSLFDGSGGFPLAALNNGITPVWASEIAPFPIRVTTKRLPQVKHLGDVSKINGAEVEPVDIITFGSPCQNMSIAGDRNGLEGDQSSLFFEAIRIIKEMRKASGKPRYIVWENVPGALSSGDREDFRRVLMEIARIKDPDVSVPRPAEWENAGEILADDYSIAWRLLNSQYFGVPQRRRRVFLVGDFDGGGAPKILFESESVCWDPAKSKEQRERYSAAFARSVGEACSRESSDENHGNGGEPENDEGPLRKGGGGKGPLIQDNLAGTVACNNDQVLFENHPQDGRYSETNVAPQITAFFGTGGGNVPLKVECGDGCHKRK